MNDKEFWLKIWRVIAGCFCVFILTAGGCEVRKHQLFANSDNPIALACSISSNLSGPCAVLLSREGK